MAKYQEVEEKLITTEDNYRCCWRHRLTGKTGHGEWLKYRDQAKAAVDFGYQLDDHIDYWIESNNKLKD